jgi:hypothetical protein
MFPDEIGAAKAGSPVYYSPQDIAEALGSMLEVDGGYEVLKSLAGTIANHAICKKNWGDARVGFAYGSNGRLYVATSGAAYEAGQGDELRQLIVATCGWKEAVFIDSIRVVTKYVKLASQQRDRNQASADHARAGEKSGCAEKKILTASVNQKWTVTKNSMDVYKMRSEGNNLVPVRDMPCASCKQCMAMYYYTKMWGLHA